MNLEQKIEAVLFWKGEPMSHNRLGEILKVDAKEVREAIANLKTGLSSRGVVLIENKMKWL